jgi:hypothetical protein
MVAAGAYGEESLVRRTVVLAEKRKDKGETMKNDDYKNELRKLLVVACQDLQNPLLVEGLNGTVTKVDNGAAERIKIINELLNDA